MAQLGQPDVYARGVEWWTDRFGALPDGGESINFSVVFFPAFVKSCRLEMPSCERALSMEELRVVAKFCVAESAWQNDTISRTEFMHFLARFGPLESSVQRMVESLTLHRELVTWFHGTITRAEAEKVLLSSSMEDGAFLVRFSESQPTRFCLSYVKVHTTGAHVGRRELRNVLIENIGPSGFVLTDSKTKAYPSIRGFIQRSASRLKHGIASPFARRCNSELAAVRVRQDLASNSYTSFSTESLGETLSAPSSPSFRPTQRSPASLLFTKTPPPQQQQQMTGENNQDEHHHVSDDNYGGFAKSSFLPPPLALKTSSRGFNTNSTKQVDDYASFSAAAVVSFERTPPGSPSRAALSSLPHLPAETAPAPPLQDSNYGEFSAFSVAVTSFSQAPRSALRRTHGSDPLCNSDSNQPNNNSHNDSTNADEYANFESFVPSETRSPPPQPPPPSPAVASASSVADTYGAFDPFNVLSSSSSVAHRLASNPPLSRPEQTPDGDYGSFAALTASSPVRRPLGTPTPPETSSNNDPADTYGTFSLSPSLQAQAPSGSTTTLPPLVLPPASLPTTADTYGSFESLLVGSTPLDPPAVVLSPSHEAPPHSAPAILTVSAFSSTAKIKQPTATSTTTSTKESTETETASALEELNAGMDFYRHNRLDDALLCFIRAREVARRARDAVVEARALGNLGTVYLDKQNPQQAVACYEQCLAITRSIQDVKREKTILNNLVLALMAAEDFDSAFQYCQIQLETTLSEINRRKILSRMSLVRERAARARREARSTSSTGTPRE